MPTREKTNPNGLNPFNQAQSATEKKPSTVVVHRPMASGHNKVRWLPEIDQPKKKADPASPSRCCRFQPESIPKKRGKKCANRGDKFATFIAGCHHRLQQSLPGGGEASPPSHYTVITIRLKKLLGSPRKICAPMVVRTQGAR